MKARTRLTTNMGKLLLSIEEVMDALSVGRGTAIKIGENAHAKVKIGRRVLYHKQRLIDYIESLEA